MYGGFNCKNKLKIFWEEGNDKGWFKLTFKNNYSTFDGHWGMIENNNEGPKLGSYYADKIDNYTLIAENNELKIFKDKIYDIVSDAVLYDYNNNTTELIKGDKPKKNETYYNVDTKYKSLYACLNWSDLTKFYKSKKTKYNGSIIWGASYGDSPSKREGLDSCKHFKKKFNGKNCNCELIDNNNENSIIVPEKTLAQLGLSNNKNYNKQIANNIIGYYEGELRYPDGALPVQKYILMKIIF